MPSCCVVINCKNKYTHTQHVSFHKFPHHKMILLKWIEFTGRENWFPSRWSSICSRHFLPTDFRKHKSRKCLRPGAIPSISPANDDNQEQFTRSPNIAKMSMNPILQDSININKDISSEDHNSDFNIMDQKTISNELNTNKTINKENRQKSEESHSIIECNNLFSNKTSSKITNSDNENIKIMEITEEIKGNSVELEPIPNECSNTIISVQIICRLCGINNVPLGSQLPLKNLEIFDMIEKCFPSLNIQINDNYSAEICEECIQNLKEFSNFTEIVRRQQQNVRIQNNYINRNEEKPRQTKNIFNIEKNTPNIKIKQEPSSITPAVGIKVKQEISDNSSYFPINSEPSSLPTYENGETEIEQQQQPNNETIDQKSSQFLNIPLINTEQVLNNCDVMEIISLDDAFIELLDDDVHIENSLNDQHQRNNENYRIPTEAKIERTDYIEKVANLNQFNLTIYNICEEHNYTRLSNEIDNNYKQENIENDSLSLNKNFIMPHNQTPLTPKKPAGIIVLNEDILKPATPLAFDLYTCHDCGLPFFFEIHLMEHRRINHPESTYFCIICNSNFNKFIDLLKHRKLSHNIKRKKSNKLSTCPMCGKNFISKLSLNNHRKYICEYQQKHRLFECKYCQIKLEKWIKLRKHEKKCRIIKEEKTEKNSPPKIIENIQTVYPSIPNRKSVQFCGTSSAIKSQIQKINYTCKICYRSYKNQHNLIRHSFVHGPIKELNFKCEDCCAIFVQLKDLQKHIRTNCKNSNNNKHKSQFNCLECGKKYKFLQGLQEHKSKIHSIIKPEHICAECKKIFNGIRNLKQHMQQHNNIRRKCPMCDKTFKQLSGLNQHKKAFHLNLKPHECPVCKRKYALKADMTRCRHSDKRLRHLKGYLSNEDIDE